MQETERSVLHVLPHAGGGGETYVDVLGEMRGYSFRRVYVAGRRKPGIGEVAAGIADLSRVLRGYDLLHVHGEATAALFLPLLAARPSVVTLHGLHLLRRVDGLRRRAAALNLHAVVRAATRTICVSNAEHAGLNGRVKVVVGDALRVLPFLRGPVDFMLLDAQKEDYLDYLKAVEPRLVKGALVIADNTGIYRREVKPYIDHVRSGGGYTSREYDFGFDCMEVSVFNG